MLCPSPPNPTFPPCPAPARSRPGRRLAQLLLCLPLWVAGLAPAQAQAQPQAPTPGPAASQEALYEAARQWVAQMQQSSPAQVRFAPMDSRVWIEPCAQPLQFDYPFSQSRETVRVRCQTPRPWQLFLRMLPPLAADIVPGAPPVAPSAAALQGQPPAPQAAQVATRPVVVTRRLVQRGTVLDPQMLEVVQRPAQGLDPLLVTSLQDVDQAEATRDLPAGTALRSYDIRRTLLVRKGQTALLTVGQGSGFQVTVRVEAMQDGFMGEQIRLKNTESGRLLSGVVTGPNAVRGLQN